MNRIPLSLYFHLPFCETRCWFCGCNTVIPRRRASAGEYLADLEREVDDDEGHAILIRENLEAAGLNNPIEHFRDGQAVLDFFASRPPGAHETYLVLLDIRMPKVRSEWWVGFASSL